MARDFKFTCDRCGRSAATDLASRWVFLVIKSTTDSVKGDAHICESCVPALDEFIPGNRSSLEWFVRHDKELVLNSDVRVMTGGCLQMIERPEIRFLAKTIVIRGKPEDWVVNNISVGNRTQFIMQPVVGIPGGVFAAGAPLQSFIKFETCQPGMDIVIEATYVGKNPEGAFFECSVYGEGYGFAPEAA